MLKAPRREQFMELLSAHQSHLFAYIYAIARDAQDAEDIFQEMSLVLWQKFDSFDGANFAGWACRTAQFKALNFLRAKRRGRARFNDELLDDLAEAAAETAEEALSQRAALERCLSKLPVQDQQLVEDCYSGGATVTAVARDLGRSTQSVCNSLRRIRRSLFDCIGRSLGQELGSHEVSG